MRGGQLPPLLRLEEIYMADVEAFERLRVELELPPTQHGQQYHKRDCVACYACGYLVVDTPPG